MIYDWGFQLANGLVAVPYNILQGAANLLRYLWLCGVQASLVHHIFHKLVNGIAHAAYFENGSGGGIHAAYFYGKKLTMEKLDVHPQVGMLIELQQYQSAAGLVAAEIRKQLTPAQLEPIEPLEETLYTMVQQADFDVELAVKGLVYFAKKGIIQVRGR